VIINTPCELVKCRQQLFREKFLSSKQVIQDIIKSDGLRGLYRGFAVSFNRDVFSFGSYFYVYYKLKDDWQEKGSLNNFKLMFAGGLTGVLTWFITYPFDTLKTVIQTDYDKKTLSQLEAYKKLVRENNSRFFILFKGLTPTLVRAFFSNAVIFYTNEMCHSILEKSF
jgi:solute carrier family 25 (mitochondrial carnitine/acylcarnitine transporter), member 20/29